MVFTCTLARAPRAKPSKKSVTSSVCKSPTRRVRTFVSTAKAARTLRSTAATARGCDGQSLVHGHEEVSGAQNAPLFAEGAVEGLPQRNANVLDRVVLVHV